MKREIPRSFLFSAFRNARSRFTPVAALLLSVCAVVGCGRSNEPSEDEIVPEQAGPNSVDYSAAQPGIVTVISTEDEFNKFVANNQIAVVKFGATWCNPCQALSPELRQQAGYFRNKAEYAEIDVDELETLARGLGVSSIPDVRVYLEGRQYAQVIGYDPHTLANLVESLCQSDAQPAAANAPESSSATPETEESKAAAPVADEETPLEDELWPESKAEK